MDCACHTGHGLGTAACGDSCIAGSVWRLMFDPEPGYAGAGLEGGT